MTAMSADQRVEVFRGLSDRARARLMPTIDEPTRASLRALLSYAPTTSGGIMTTEHVEAPATWTVERALAHIRDSGHPHRPVYAVYVLDPVDRRLVHVVTLRELVMADPARTLLEVGERNPPVTVGPWTHREETARLIAKYDLLAVPVVDEGGHLLGIVTVDDMIDAMVKEQTEDLHKLGGVEALDEPYTKIGFGTMIRKRAGWLCALFLSEMLTATAMQYFEGELSRAIVLTLFIPLVMSSGGNSGSQATSLIIRALALREVTVGDWWRIAVREIPAGVALGAILGAIGIVRISAWQVFGFYDYGRALAPDRPDRGRGAGGRGDVRLPRGLDAPVRPPPGGLRPRERVGSLRGHPGRRHRARHLLLGRVPGAAGYAALAGSPGNCWGRLAVICAQRSELAPLNPLHRRSDVWS